MALKSTAAMAISKKYTADTATSLGSLTGAPCTIKSITTDASGNNVVTFEWTGTTGTKQTSTMTVPPGVSVTGVTSIDATHFVLDLSDGTQTAQITIPEQNVTISPDSGNALTKKANGLFVAQTGVTIDPDTNNQLVNTANGLMVDHDTAKVNVNQTVANAGKALIVGADGNVTTGDAGVKVSTKTNNAIQTITTASEEGIFVDITGKVDKVTGKELILSTLIPKITDNESHIGDVTTIIPSGVSSLVAYCNALYNSFMTSITYASKKLTITYRNGLTTDIDLSAIITDTNIGELNNIDDTGVADKQVLAYDLASQKYKPFTVDTAQVLADAKQYTDDEIDKINVSEALAVDELPVYDGSVTPAVIKYKQAGVDKTTDNMKTWFYYHDTTDNKDYQTIFLNGVAFSLAVANSVDFDDYCKVVNVVSTYTGSETDKTKLPNLAALDALKTLIGTDLSAKVNTADIVDNLTSTDAAKPLSANQGKILNDSKFNATTSTIYAGKAVIVDTDGALTFGEAGVQVSAETGNQIVTKSDGIYVDKEIHEITQADYDAKSSTEIDGKYWNITDATPTPINTYLIDDTATSTSKAYSSDKVADLISDVNDNLGGEINKNWNESGYNLNPFPYYNINGFSHVFVTYNYDNDGIINTTGTSTAESYFRMLSSDIDIINKLVVGKKYRVSGCPSGGSTSTYMVNFYINDGTSNIVSIADVGNGAEFTMPSGGQSVSFGIRIKTGVDSSGLEFKPMIVEVSSNGTYPTEYQRYANGNVELTDSLLETKAKNYYNLYSYKAVNNSTITCVKNDDESITVNTILDASGKFTNTSPIVNGESIDLYDLRGKKLYLWIELISGTISLNWVGFVVTKRTNDGTYLANEYPNITDNSIGNKLIKVYDVNELIESGVRYLSLAPWCSNNNKYTDAVMKISVLDEPIHINNHIDYTNDITENERKALDVKMLGWSVPKDLKVRNRVDASGVYHQRVDRVDLGSLNWTYVASMGFTNNTLTTAKANGLGYILGYTNIPNTAWGGGENTFGFNASKVLWIKNKTYTTATDFKNAMSGVYLYYELETEITKKVDGNEIIAELRNDVEDIGAIFLGTKNSGVTCANAGAETVIGSIALPKGVWLINCGGYNPLDITSGNGATNISLKGYWGSMTPLNNHTFNMSVVIELTATKTLELAVVNWESSSKTSITNYDFVATRLK